MCSFAAMETERIKVWPIAIAAWRGLGRAFAAQPLTFLVTMALYAGLSAAMAGLGRLPKWLFRYGAEQTTWANGFTYLAAHLAVAVVTSVILTPLVVSVHRTLLTDRVRAPWGAVARNMFFWLLGLQLFFTVLLAAPLIASAVGFVRGLLNLIAQIILVFVIRRLVLLTPAVAIGVPAKSAEDRIDASWTLMEGRFWLYIRLGLLTLAPMQLLLGALNRIGIPKPPNPPPIVMPPPAPLPVTKLLLIGQASAGVVWVILVALAASAVSMLYVRLKRD